MMRLKHRCNSVGKIFEALQQGYDGVEIDLVWSDGELVLNHEHGEAGELFHWVLNQIPPEMPLAINVKEYGMVERLVELLDARTMYFIFDVPGPELEAYAAASLLFFGRLSEYDAQLGGVGNIIDSFESSEEFLRQALEWLSEDGVDHVALISPTLRGKPEWPPALLEDITFLVTK